MTEQKNRVTKASLRAFIADREQDFLYGEPIPPLWQDVRVFAGLDMIQPRDILTNQIKALQKRLRDYGDLTSHGPLTDRRALIELEQELLMIDSKQHRADAGTEKETPNA